MLSFKRDSGVHRVNAATFPRDAASKIVCCIHLDSGLGRVDFEATPADGFGKHNIRLPVICREDPIVVIALREVELRMSDMNILVEALGFAKVERRTRHRKDSTCWNRILAELDNSVRFYSECVPEHVPAGVT